ncbi:hypothetical protein BU15DRAFT_67584 [Melanogaster broomeanus]|nr:hypothetical protein BU15DRAFT_67584 [Melanogaster broomeanus]
MTHECLGCEAVFKTRKQLSAHTSQCAEHQALTLQILDRERKADRKYKEDKKAHSVRPSTAIDEGVLGNEDVVMQQAPSPIQEPSGIFSGRSGRRIRLPARFDDYLPGSSTHLAHMPLSAQQQRLLNPGPAPAPSPSPSSNSQSERSNSPPIPTPLVPFTTEPDQFGLYRIYANLPTQISIDTLHSVSDAPSLRGTSNTEPTVVTRARLGVPGARDHAVQDVFAPFSNPTCGILMAWQYSGTNQKSGAELDRLAQLQTHPLYDPKDLAGFSHTREARLLDKYLDSEDNPFNETFGWRKSSVKIRLPNEKTKWPSEANAPQMTIDGVWHRDLVDIITESYQNPASTTFNTTPFTQHWRKRIHHRR